MPYIVKSGADELGFGFWLIQNRIGQWVVALFLFYSGYGVMESIKNKGCNYVQDIPKRRVLNTLVNFDIAVIVFIAVGLLLGTSLTFKQCLLSLTGWESVGNSNWYIFVILLCYAITYVSFIKQKNLVVGAIVCSGLLLLASLFLSCFKDDYWYNTMWCYGAGMFFSLYLDKVEYFVNRHYSGTLVVVLVLATIAAQIPLHAKGIVYNIFSVLFCAVIVLLTMKFNLKNPVLQWCGKNLFPLYIYQRIPMIILASIGNGVFVANYPMAYVFVCLLTTVVIAYFYKYWAVKF